MFARTERLLLRPSWAEDAATVYAAIADKAIIRNLAHAPWPYGLNDAADFVRQPNAEHFPKFLLWQRTLTDPRLIGGCGLNNEGGKAMLGYWIARQYWGLGYASEAARAVVDIAKALGHETIYARHFADNPASGKVLRKIGFIASGRTVMRQSHARTQPAESVQYGLNFGSGDNAQDDDPDAMRSYRPYDAELLAA